ncbi:MAG TPA: erythromycin esterase family protein [Chthoniobacterales bacterium]|nr:erythromycin esterase family protein [Chthoniobacterales bacterium]
MKGSAKIDDKVERDAVVIRRDAHEISSASDYDALVEMAGAAQCVLIGEASHGTHEFYATRAALTRRLIAENGFYAIGLEADWPDMFRVHRFVQGRSEDADARTALSDFRRFPGWMWRNTVVLEFVEWLRNWNTGRKTPDTRVGMYGLDLYSMHSSIEAVLRYLDQTDPAAARRARDRYACFEHFSVEPQLYGHATVVRGKEPCEDEVIAQLVDVRRKYADFNSRDGHVAEEEFFSAEQNARLVMNAERYYRSMFHGRDESWNLRDSHMLETLSELFAHLDGGQAKIIVWAHNSHLGDARATEMSARGEWNLGQLVRERLGSRAFAIGFSTYGGTVTAASDWGEPAENKRLRPAWPGSYEEFFHATRLPRFWLDLRADNAATSLLRHERLQRAIGVICRPETERSSHYFYARLPEQFDAMIHLDETRALEPLERTSQWERAELPETYPEGL